MSLVEWADQNRYLSGQSSALPGRWRTDRVECAREVMLAATDPNVKQITIMACSQLMKSEFLNNLIAYHIDNDPCPMILMQPTVAMAQSYSKDRIEPMIRDTPVLRNIVKEKKSRDSQNTILHKVFPGGQLTMIGANSPSELASRPVRLIMCDEVDRFPESAGKEGDPIGLIYERSATFHNRKLVVCSTPTIEGRSRVETEYELSDKRVFCAPCPKCGESHELLFENVQWTDNDPDTATYVCPACEAKWTETDRVRAISKGFYKATAPFKGHAGFKVNKLGSPWESLSTLVTKYLKAKDDSEKLKVFTNTQLANTFVEKGEAPEHMRLYERREKYNINTVPDHVAFLTAGTDVQKTYLAVEIVGWCRDKQSYSIDYRIITGDTATPAPWLELDKILNETWTNSSGRQMSIRMMAVDSGFNTQHVYDWVKKHSPDRVRAIKGSDKLQQIFGTPKDIDLNRDGNKLRRACKVWPLGVSVIKQELYSWLRLDGAGDDGKFSPGFCHFPEYDEEYFKGLCSEHLIKKSANGQATYKWVKKYERNEPLDVRNYARGAASMFGMDRFSAKDWDIVEGKYDPPTPKPSLPKAGTEKSKQGNSEPVRSPQSDYWARQRQR